MTNVIDDIEDQAMSPKRKILAVVTLSAVTLVAACDTPAPSNPSSKFAGNKSSVFSENSRARRGDDGGSDR